LTSLGFTNRKRMNTGFILWLDLETRKRIHNLARAYAIDQESQFQEDGFSSNCDLCKNLGSKSTRTEIKGDS
jgi:tRNA 2-selenouridine synthase SelU